MFNPKMFSKPANSSQRVDGFKGNLALQKITGFQKSRWDEPITVPQILYQKFKINPPKGTNSDQTSKVTNNYSSSLIDFIRRAYARCKNLPQKKLMQSQLRELIQKNSSKLNQINWQSLPLPTVNTGSSQPSVNLRHHSIPIQSISNPSFVSNTSLVSNISSRSLLDKIQKPNPQIQTKVKSMLSKKLQMLEEKYGHEDQNKTKQPQKTFIGFKDQRQVKMEQLKLKYEQMNQEKIKAAKLAQQKKQIQLLQQQRQSQMPKPVQKPSQPLKVIQTITPEKVQFSKKPTQIVSKQSKAQAKSIKITKKDLSAIVKATQDPTQLRAVAKRFTQFNKIKSRPVGIIQQAENISQEQMDYKMIGKCKQISKPYLRITHRPDPQSVRPQSILRKAFNHFKNQYKSGTHYDIIISQFKSIRQDLTVQDIRNSFTVEVYQENFKISLFQDDIIQLKQCQTNLWELYRFLLYNLGLYHIILGFYHIIQVSSFLSRQGLYNKKMDRAKFISYHFISMILQEKYKELQYMLSLIAAEVLQAKQIQQSLKLKKYLVIGNYKAFFSFYTKQDQMCQKLINQYIDKIRVKCLVIVCKTFGQKIKFSQLADNIGQDQDILQVLAREQGAVIQEDCLMLKESYEKLKDSQYLKVRKVTSLLD